MTPLPISIATTMSQNPGQHHSQTAASQRASTLYVLVSFTYLPTYPTLPYRPTGIQSCCSWDPPPPSPQSLHRGRRREGPTELGRQSLARAGSACIGPSRYSLARGGREDDNHTSVEKGDDQGVFFFCESSQASRQAGRGKGKLVSSSTSVVM
ncbi:hypothetical protein LY76DRAFT_427952 [Colletotrichum caudatum]|nr:hypothetical protein LY76DRAFT_427952 [Colletotrichum caudatum]